MAAYMYKVMFADHKYANSIHETDPVCVGEYDTLEDADQAVRDKVKKYAQHPTKIGVVGATVHYHGLSRGIDPVTRKCGEFWRDAT